VETKKQVVYVVDDDRNDVDLFSRILEQNGYFILKGYDFREVISYLRQNTPDCIVSNGKYHRGHGLTILRTLRELRERGDFDRVGFVMVSGEEDDALYGTGDVVEELGGKFLEKPLKSLEELVKAVREQISLRQRL